jgi:hypothetical protein
MHTGEMHAYKMHAHEMHTYEMHAYERRSEEIAKAWGLVQNGVSFLVLDPVIRPSKL